ncbi:MAG: methionine aminotransferase [Chloroflexota bacterium]|nr:methionine aminotransferase [Chloroflexota bacterium]
MREVAAARIGGFGTSIFTEMTRLAIKHQAVNLGQGFPDFAGPDFVKEAAAAAIFADHNQYAPSHGVPRLRSAIAAMWGATYGREIDPDSEVTVTTGATEGMLAALLALVDPGDEVILFEPFYDAYVGDIIYAGGVPRYVTLQPPDWSFDPDALAAAFTAKTKVLILNTPHNPTGKVFTRDDLAQIAALCQKHEVIAITDEVYDRIIFDDAMHVPLATLPGMWERTLTLNSTGKTFSMTGWKIGYAIGPARLNAALRTVHQFSVFATATPFQEAMATAFQEAEARGYYTQLTRDYTARRDTMRAMLEGAGLPTLKAGGTFFLLADVTGFGTPDDVAACFHLIETAGVVGIPPSVFYADASRAALLIRFCFAKKPETLAAAAERFARLGHGRA